MNMFPVFKMVTVKKNSVFKSIFLFPQKHFDTSKLIILILFTHINSKKTID